MPSPSTVLPSPAADQPRPTAADRLRRLDQLSLLWRLTIDRLTDLSVELHGLGSDAPPERVSSVEARLAAARRTLVEIETAMYRLRWQAASAVVG